MCHGNSATVVMRMAYGRVTSGPASLGFELLMALAFSFVESQIPASTSSNVAASQHYTCICPPPDVQLSIHHRSVQALPCIIGGLLLLLL